MITLEIGTFIGILAVAFCAGAALMAVALSNGHKGDCDETDN